jgi:hypothetical protein
MFKKYRQRRKAKRTNDSIIKIKDSELKKFIKESLNVTDLKIINPRGVNHIGDPILTPTKKNQKDL